MANSPTYEQLKQRVDVLEKEALDRKRISDALRESARRLEVAYDQSIIYAQQLSEEILERKRTSKELQEAHHGLEERVEKRTVDLLQANDLLRKEINERARAEEALKESETRLTTVLDTIQAGIVVIDPKTHTIVGVNAAAGKMVGAPMEKILGRVCHRFICPAEDGQCPVTDLEQNLENTEFIFLKANGKRFPVLKTVVSVTLQGRKHLLESFLDITDLKDAEGRMRESEKQVYRHQKRTDMLKFANDMALKLMHELRNPLVAIAGFSRLLSKRDFADNKLREYAQIILEQSKRLDKAVNEVLDHLKASSEQA